MQKITILRYNTTSPGVMVIIDALTRVLLARGYEVDVIDKLPARGQVIDTLFTYGPKETYDAIKKGFKVDLSMMVDYHSLGQLTKANNYMKFKKYLDPDLWYSLLTGLIYKHREKVVFDNVDNFMFVSRHDVDRISQRFPDRNIYCVPNGVDLPFLGSYHKSRSDKIRLGILSNWNKATLSECRWFLDKWLPQVCQKLPNVQVVIAGRGASHKIEKYFKSRPNVIYLGEVENLNAFFRNIDFYLATVPRGVGILNKVLDAFAHKVPVIGIPESFSGFTDMKGCYIMCNTVDELIDAIRELTLKPAKGLIMAEDAYDYIVENNNWDVNYNLFVDKLEQDGILRNHTIPA